jgi:protein-disulfide isomerase
MSAALYVMGKRQQDALGELRREIGQLRAEQGALKRNSRRKAAVARQMALHDHKDHKPPTHITTGNTPFRGSQNAPVVLIEFSDYQCPSCGQFAREVMPRIEKHYIQTGKVRYVFRDLPLEQIHPHAFKAAAAARCAGEASHARTPGA